MMRSVTRFASLFVALGLAMGSAHAQQAPNPYKVRGLSQDVTAESVQAATAQAQARAKAEGAQRLLERLTLPEDRTAQIDINQIVRAAGPVGYDTQSKVTATRFIAVLNVTYTAATVRNYLDSLRVPFVESQAGLAVIAPVAASGLDGAAWAGAWAGKDDNTVLTPYLVSTASYPRRPAWQDVQGEVASRQARRAIVAEAYGQAGQVYVRLFDLGNGAGESQLAIAGPFADYGSAQAGAIAELETAWKRASVVRTTGQSSMELVASFQTVGQWAKIKTGLEASRLVSGLNVEAVSATGADISFVFAGRPDQLASDLRAKGLALASGDRGWTLTAQ